MPRSPKITFTVVLTLTCLALLGFTVYRMWPRLKRSWVRHRLSFGTKPQTPKPQTWQPHRHEPWHHDPGNVLAVIAVLCAFALAFILKRYLVN